MKRIQFFVWLMIIVMGAALAFAQEEKPPVDDSKRPLVGIITIDGSINPGSADYIMNSVNRAKSMNMAALVIELDTPGGLVESTRDIVQALLNSEIPVVVYVTPAGAHAGSAGVMITLAGNVAAMAPGTNIGAASPVSSTGEMDETMKKKVTNDVAAWVEGIAIKRERNKEWAIQAVREAVSVTATEAKKIGVIDYLAESTTELLDIIDGHTVTISGKEIKLHTKNAEQVRFTMSLKHRIITRLADPNLAYLFMIIGFLGIYAEFSHPGMIFPGVIGGICLLLFLLATQVLPINTVGLVLIVVGLGLFVLEIKFTSYGMLTMAGLVSLTMGSLFLFDVPEKIVDYPTFNLQVSWSYIIPSVLVLGGFVLGVTYLILRTHKRQPETGQEGIVGKIGEAYTDLEPGIAGQIRVVGEYWKAVSTEPVVKGEKIIVTKASSQGLSLTVKKYRPGDGSEGR